MSNAARNLDQVLRLDGNGCFAEILLGCLHLDKALVNFVQYNKGAEKGSRTQNTVGIFMNVLEAQVLSNDIMSGRLSALAKRERARVQEAREKYANAVFTKQGGTPANRNNGQAIARVFEIAPGASKPWILCAKQGKAHETPEGLIVMDGRPDVTIRVPCTDDQLKLFATALQVTTNVWTQLRFVPVVAQSMQEAQDRRQEAINKAKASSSGAQNNLR